MFKMKPSEDATPTAAAQLAAAVAAIEIPARVALAHRGVTALRLKRQGLVEEQRKFIASMGKPNAPDNRKAGAWLHERQREITDIEREIKRGKVDLASRRAEWTPQLLTDLKPLLDAAERELRSGLAEVAAAADALAKLQGAAEQHQIGDQMPRMVRVGNDILSLSNMIARLLAGPGGA